MKNNILITGGAGFIGSHLVQFFVKNYSDYNIINLDLLTYASNIDNLNNISNHDNYTFIKLDICNYNEIKKIFSEYKISHVIHLAAESHVDRSIQDPFSFAKTNVLGTLSLLQAAKEYWNLKKDNNLFYHVSTDEVYGSLGSTGAFSEESKYDPHSPYSASKASSDHFVRSFKYTYNLPIKISNCSNNYGPNQNTEKLIPTIIKNIYNEKKLPIYGDGTNVRDWLYVEDHVKAIDKIFHHGRVGQTYNIGGNNEWSNIDLVNRLIEIIDFKLNKPKGYSKKLITFIEDRKGHDFRYAIDGKKIEMELCWKPETNFNMGLDTTINSYILS